MAPLQEWENSSGKSGSAIAGPYDELSRALAEAPRPRTVRMSGRGKSTVAMVAVILLVSMGLFVFGLTAKSAAVGRNAGAPQFLPFLLPIIFILVIVPVMLRTVLRQKPLLAEGEMAVGLVTKRWRARHGPKIHYTFMTPLGEHFSRDAADGPGQLQEGMNVPIFYDPRNPKKQMALCSSLYEVVLPGQ